MKQISLVITLFFAGLMALPVDSIAQNKVIKGPNYWVLDNIKMTSADRSELVRLLGQLQNQDDYRMTIQTKKKVTTYGDMSLSDIQLINTEIAAENTNARGFTLFHDCLYEHNGECSLVHEYIYTTEERIMDDPVADQIDALLEKYQ